MIVRRAWPILASGVVGACGAFAAASDDSPDAPPDAAADEASPMDGSPEASDGFAADSGPGGSSFCDLNPGAKACEDFDRDAAIDGGFAMLDMPGSLPLTRVFDMKYSEPGSGRITIPTVMVDLGSVGGFERFLVSPKNEIHLEARVRLTRQASTDLAPITIMHVRLKPSTGPDVDFYVNAGKAAVTLAVCQPGCLNHDVTASLDDWNLVALTASPAKGLVALEVGGAPSPIGTFVAILDGTANTWVGALSTPIGGDRTLWMDNVLLTTSP